jgi:hypothetical protein
VERSRLRTRWSVVNAWFGTTASGWVSVGLIVKRISRELDLLFTIDKQLNEIESTVKKILGALVSIDVALPICPGLLRPTSLPNSGQVSFK